jgi:hypothetical protein
MTDRLQAATLLARYPQTELVRIELIFSDAAARTPPSPQLHTLYPAAPAFFRFACPVAECDGDFDLTEAVAAIVANAQARKRVAVVEGKLGCTGLRLRHTPCPMQLSYTLRAEPRRPAS